MQVPCVFTCKYRVFLHAVNALMCIIYSTAKVIGQFEIDISSARGFSHSVSDKLFQVDVQKLQNC